MSKEEKTNLYEGMFVLSGGISDDQQQASLTNIETEISTQGGAVRKKIDFGRRKLAYEMEGQGEGHYHLWYFEAKPSAIKELWRELRLNRESLHLPRFMTLRADSIPEEIKFKPVNER